MADLFEKLLYYFRASLEPYGFEVYQFLTDWYNEVVDQPFHLSYPRFTLAYVVLSTPSMFEKTFIPFVKSSSKDILEEGRDTIDQCVRSKIEEVREECTLINNEEIDIFYDYDMTPNRRPKILVQTAGDVAGAVRLYQDSEIKDRSRIEPMKRKLYPCAVHPYYGGWFAVRSVIIFKNLINPLLEEPTRLELLKNEDQITDLLLKYNLHWEDWTFRDVIDPIERYSDLQKLYFQTPPKERGRVLQQIIEYDSDVDPAMTHDESEDTIEEASDVMELEELR